MRKACFLVFVFLSLFLCACNNGSQNSSTEENKESEAEKQAKIEEKYFFYNESKGTFDGYVYYQPSNINMKTLIAGFVDNVYWRIRLPFFNNEIVWQENATDIVYYENTEALALSISTSPWGDDKTNLLKWSDVSGIKVEIIINFSTGSSYIIAEKNMYKGPTEKNMYGPQTPSLSISDCLTEEYFQKKDDNGLITEVGYEYKLKPAYKIVGNNGITGFIKIKSAKAYFHSGRTSDIVIDWTDNLSLICLYTDTALPKSFEPRIMKESYDYGYEINTINDIEKLELKTVTGETIICNNE